MPLEPIDELMRRAVVGGYALGYFESWNLESLQGVIDAAEATRSPIIIGFNGDFLSRPDRLAARAARLVRRPWGGGGRVGLRPLRTDLQRVPGRRLGPRGVDVRLQPRHARRPGGRRRTTTRDRVAGLTRMRHEHGVAVEAEVGELPSGVSGGRARRRDRRPIPALAAEFVEATGVDLLAVSVGNVHIKLDGTQGLDLERLEEIRRRVAVPLVLHGGTGIAAGVAPRGDRPGRRQGELRHLPQAAITSSAVRAALGRRRGRPAPAAGDGRARGRPRRRTTRGPRRGARADRAPRLLRPGVIAGKIVGQAFQPDTACQVQYFPELWLIEVAGDGRLKHCLR